MKKVKYFHKLTEKQFNKIHPDTTWGELNDTYKQPDWCGYPNAVSPLGCWSLIGFMVTDEDYCKNCDCYIPPKDQL